MYFQRPGDAEHPFGEVIGLLQKIEVSAASNARIFHVLRRTGELVAVDESRLLSFKLVR